MKLQKHEFLPYIGKPNIARCNNCYLFKQVNRSQVSYSRDGINYTIIGEAHPLPVCVPVKKLAAHE